MTKDTQSNDPLAAMESLLSDPTIIEILVDGYDKVYIERQSRGNQFEDVPSPFRDNDHLMEVINAIVEPYGYTLGPNAPFANLHLSDNTLVNVTVPPASPAGPTLTLRKFNARPISFEQLVEWGSISEPIIEFLQACVQAKLNIAVSGGTNSGKTTVLNLVGSMIAAGERIITVEHMPEVKLPGTLKYVVGLQSGYPGPGSAGVVTLDALLQNALQMRPDRLILGETSDGDAVLTFLNAMTRGYDGGMMVMHATSPRDALARLEMTITSAQPHLPLLNVRHKIASSLDLITYQEQLPDGSRKLVKVSEVIGMQGDTIATQDILEFRQTGKTEEGRITGVFTATGAIPTFLPRLKDAGIDLPLSFFSPG